MKFNLTALLRLFMRKKHHAPIFITINYFTDTNSTTQHFHQLKAGNIAGRDVTHEGNV
ncbi:MULTISPECIES: hypothetical protein [Haemophilus]|jgi:hypothetical protein|uniref:hypothetical protein n=1 Tax=Haemophilus TaxID=724 RepID=UPI0015E1171F|nr:MULTISPECIES: hypothetical protein [Haemophilus]MBS6046875.1 hypothetical protein [Haemophilus haemolyticus]MDK7280786.1 hypothetical protein [Haemophilus seminalis]